MANFLKSLFVKGVEIDTAGATTGDVLKFDGAKFGAGSVGGSTVSALDDLSDVVVTAPEEFQGLSYNGTSWVNSHIPLVSYVRNAESTTITTGTCVYLFGATGDHATVKRADNNNDTTSSKTIGVAGANITASNNGPIVTRGYVDGIDLSTGYTAGDILWLGENGAFTTTKPSSPDHLVFIGVVVRATNNGIIYVATQNGYELDEIHNVSLPSPNAGEFLKYNGSLWVADAIDLGTDTTGNYMSDISGTSPVSVSHTPGEGSSASVSLASAYGDTQNPYGSKTANYVLAAPDGSSGAPSFRALATADIPYPGSANQIIYKNGSNAATGSSALTYDGTDFSVGGKIRSTVSSGDEGGEFFLAQPQTNNTLSGGITIDAYQNKLRFFEQGGSARGFYLDMTAGTAGVGTNLLTGGGGATTLDGLNDVTAPSPTSGDFLKWNGTAWVNDAIDLGTDTTGNYVSGVSAGTGISVSHTPSEGSTATISVDTTYSGFVPAGTVVAYAGTVVPTGWLPCDGSAVSRTTYAALWNALGTTSSAWGQGNGSTTFNVPNMTSMLPYGGTSAASSPTVSISANTDHTHTANAGNESANHNHTINANAGNQSADHIHTITSNAGNQSADHTHNWGNNTGYVSNGHTHNYTDYYGNAAGTKTTNDINQNHYHYVSGTTAGMSVSHNHAVTSNAGNQSANHNHAVASTAGSQSANHNHTITVASTSSMTHSHTLPVRQFIYIIKV